MLQCADHCPVCGGCLSFSRVTLPTGKAARLYQCMNQCGYTIVEDPAKTASKLRAELKKLDEDTAHRKLEIKTELQSLGV